MTTQNSPLHIHASVVKVIKRYVAQVVYHHKCLDYNLPRNHPLRRSSRWSDGWRDRLEPKFVIFQFIIDSGRFSLRVATDNSSQIVHLIAGAFRIDQLFVGPVGGAFFREGAHALLLVV